jgi:ribosomal protein S15P/S13E
MKKKDLSNIFDEQMELLISRLIASLKERVVAYKKDPKDRRNFNTYTFYRGKLLAYFTIYWMLNPKKAEHFRAYVESSPILEDYDGMDATDEGYEKYVELIKRKRQEGKAPCERETPKSGC